MADAEVVKVYQCPTCGATQEEAGELDPMWQVVAEWQE
jgi:hypothetical protein